VKEETIMATGKRERNEVVEQQLEQALRTMHDAHRRNDLAYLDEAICGIKRTIPDKSA
jgi:hypothetical protein